MKMKTMQTKIVTVNPVTGNSKQYKNLCSSAAATLESSLLGARKGEIEWALTKAQTAVKTLKRAKSLMPPNRQYANQL